MRQFFIVALGLLLARSPSVGGTKLLARTRSPPAGLAEAEAAELLQEDLGQTEIELRELNEKRSAWSALCNLQPHGSAEWLQCVGVLERGLSEVNSKGADIASYEHRLALLGASEQARTNSSDQHGTVSNSSTNQSQMDMQATEDASEDLADRLGTANSELDELMDKRDQWRLLCAGPPATAHPNKALRGISDVPNCLKVVSGIEADIASKNREIASYQAASDALQG